MLVTFERFAEQEFWSEKDLDPFVRSHPVAAHRLNQLRDKVAASPYANDKDPPQLQHRHDMMGQARGPCLGAARSSTIATRPATLACPHATARAIARNCSRLCAGDPEIDAPGPRQAGQPLFLGAEELYVLPANQCRQSSPCAGLSTSWRSSSAPIRRSNRV